MLCIHTTVNGLYTLIWFQKVFSKCCLLCILGRLEYLRGECNRIHFASKCIRIKNVYSFELLLSKFGKPLLKPWKQHGSGIFAMICLTSERSLSKLDYQSLFGLASSPYETSTVCVSVRLSVCDISSHTSHHQISLVFCIKFSFNKCRKVTKP